MAGADKVAEVGWCHVRFVDKQADTHVLPLATLEVKLGTRTGWVGGHEVDMDVARRVIAVLDDFRPMVHVPPARA